MTPKRVLRTHFKISEQEISQADILRTATNLLNDLEKLYESDNAEHQEVLEAFNENHNIYNSQFFAKIRNKALQQIKQNHLALQALITIFYKHIKAYRRFSSAIKRLRHIRSMLLEEFITTVPEIIPKMYIQTHLSHLELHRIILCRKLLLRSINEREFIMLASRKYQINRVIQLLILQSENNIDFFKGMSLENQKNFIRHYFEIKEWEIMEKAQIEFRIQNKQEKTSKKIKYDTALITSFSIDKLKSDLGQCQEKSKRLEELTLQKIKKLGSKTGNNHVNNNLADNHCLEKCRTFENHSIMEPLQAHLRVVMEHAHVLQSEKQELMTIEQELETIQDDCLTSLDSAQAKKANDLEFLLDQIDFDPDIELSQLSEISLLDSMGKKPR